MASSVLLCACQQNLAEAGCTALAACKAKLALLLLLLHRNGTVVAFLQHYILNAYCECVMQAV